MSFCVARRQPQNASSDGKPFVINVYHRGNIKYKYSINYAITTNVSLTLTHFFDLNIMAIML